MYFPFDRVLCNRLEIDRRVSFFICSGYFIARISDKRERDVITLKLRWSRVNSGENYNKIKITRVLEGTSIWRVTRVEKGVDGVLRRSVQFEFAERVDFSRTDRSRQKDIRYWIFLQFSLMDRSLTRSIHWLVARAENKENKPLRHRAASERSFFFLIARATKSDVINHSLTSSWLVDWRAGKRHSTLRIIDCLSCRFRLVFSIVIYPGRTRKSFFERVLTKVFFSFAHREAIPMPTFSLFGRNDDEIFHQTTTFAPI